MARPNDTKSARITRRVLKARLLINADVPKMEAYRLAGIGHKTYYHRINIFLKNESAIEAACRSQSA